MKTILKIILLTGVVGYLVFAIYQFGEKSEDRLCEGLLIEIPDSIPGGFVNKVYIQSLLADNHISPEGNKQSDVDMDLIDSLLAADPHIDSVHCFFNALGKLCIEVVPQRPVLHIIPARGREYYLSSLGNTMPTDTFNVDLCVATGNISQQTAKEKLIVLAQFIEKDDFWREQIEQINVINDDEVELIPRVGHHVIELGNIDNLDDKFQRLMAFYQKGLPAVGWNKYQTISLAYDGQIVCTKRSIKKN